MNLLFCIYFTLIVFDGVVRGTLFAIGLDYLAYIKDVIIILMAMYAGPVYLMKLSKNGFCVTKFLFYVVILILYSVFVAILHDLGWGQVLFATRAVIPLVIGFMIWNMVSAARLAKCFTWLSIVASLGVLGNVLVVYPWQNLAVNEHGIQASHLGEIGTAIERLPGFGVSSGITGVTILSLWFFVVLYRLVIAKEFGARWTWYSVVIAAGIFTTTSKAASAAFVIMTALLWLTFFYLRRPNRFRLLAVKFAYALPLAMVVLPFLFSALYYKVYYHSIGIVNPNLFIDNSLDRALFASFADRMINTWPAALDMIHENGSLLLGRGMGGIGDAQKIFEAELYNPGDGFLVTLISTFGIFPAGLILIWLLRTAMKPLYAIKFDSRMLIAAFLASLGWAQDIIDAPFLLLLIGILYNFGKLQNASLVRDSNKTFG